MIPRSEWVWYGFSGHFVCGEWCRFHLCTKVGLYVVSTVGKYVHPRHSNGSERNEREFLMAHPHGEEIGHGRFYETMVFVGGEPCDEKECGCGQPRINGCELDYAPANTPGEAGSNHYKLCLKWASEKQ